MSVRELRLRVALKLLTAFALVCILIFSLRYVFNVQSQPRGGSQKIDVATLELYQTKSFTRVGKELLLVRTGQDRFLLINQRSPEFSCLLEMSVEQTQALLKDPCTGDLFDLEGKVLPNQRAKRNLSPLPYRWQPPATVLVED